MRPFSGQPCFGRINEILKLTLEELIDPLTPRPALCDRSISAAWRFVQIPEKACIRSPPALPLDCLPAVVIDLFWKTTLDQQQIPSA